MTVEERNKIIKETERLIKETGAAALEGNINQYAMLRDYFPEMDKIVHFARPYVEVRKNLLIKNIGKDRKVKFFVVEEY